MTDTIDRAVETTGQSVESADCRDGVQATVRPAEQPAEADRQLAAARAQIDNLNRALETSRCIGMAMGVVMARAGLKPDEAFDVLRAASQRTHRKLREIAEDVVFTGEVPAA